MTREVLQMALEYMERHAVIDGIPVRDALRKALAQPVRVGSPNLLQPEPFKPDWNTEAVLVEEMQRMAKQIAEMQNWEAVAADQAMTIAMMQCEQEPVATVIGKFLTRNDELRTCIDPELPLGTKLYASPPQQELESTTNMMMGLVERLGELPDDVDPRAWSHLLVYAPQRQPLTEERNFCPRCGKRLAPGFTEISIHTCTPPKAKND